MQSRAEAVDLAENAIRKEAEKHLPHAALYLFGSRARATGSRRSDFDLAIVPKEGYSVRERLAFAEALEASPDIIYPVDLVDCTEASRELMERIRREGELWKS